MKSRCGKVIASAEPVNAGGGACLFGMSAVTWQRNASE